jgi:hypothetical protein
MSEKKYKTIAEIDAELDKAFKEAEVEVATTEPESEETD